MILFRKKRKEGKKEKGLKGVVREKIRQNIY
jgi:hypothetical protein